eukprot:jgi/Chrzof1/1797/Cz10g21140.t1
MELGGLCIVCGAVTAYKLINSPVMGIPDRSTTAMIKDREYLKPKSVVYNDHLRQQALHVQRGLDNISIRYLQPEPRNIVMFNERGFISSILYDACAPARKVGPRWLFWDDSGKSTSSSPDEPTQGGGSRYNAHVSSPVEHCGYNLRSRNPSGSSDRKQPSLQGPRAALPEQRPYARGRRLIPDMNLYAYRQQLQQHLQSIVGSSSSMPLGSSSSNNNGPEDAFHRVVLVPVQVKPWEVIRITLGLSKGTQPSIHLPASMKAHFDLAAKYGQHANATALLRQEFSYMKDCRARYGFISSYFVSYLLERTIEDYAQVSGPIFWDAEGPNETTLRGVLVLLQQLAVQPDGTFTRAQERKKGQPGPAAPGGSGAGAQGGNVSSKRPGPSRKPPSGRGVKVHQSSLQLVPRSVLQLGHTLGDNQYAPEAAAGRRNPSFLGHGLTFHGLQYFIALSVAPGKTLSQLPHIDNAVRSAALAGLDALHEGGVIHGDVHGGNIVVDLKPGQAPKVTFIDLGHAWLSEQLEPQDRAERQARDRHALLGLLPRTED